MPKQKKETESPPPPTEQKTFFEEQTVAIGYNESEDFAYYSQHPDEPFGKKKKHPLFWSDTNGDLHIGIMDLSGDLITYDSKDSRSRLQIQPISIKRLQRPLGDTKYLPAQKGWGTFPYPTKLTVKAFQEKKEVKKLVIVEGFKKAFAISKKLGLPCIGIPGISQWKGKKDDEIYNIIKDVIQVCKVKELIFLADADTLEVKYNERKDLYRRPFSFYTAVKIYKELTKDFGIACYFVHIKLQYVETSKGIDDLMNQFNTDEQLEEIKKEIIHSSGLKKYFDKFNVEDKTLTAIKDYFGIANPWDARKFYYKYEDIIGLNRFIYNNSEWQFDDNTNELICHKSAYSTQFIMIQDTIFMKGAAPTIGQKKVENVLIPVSDRAITIMMKNDKKKVERIKSEMDYFHGAYNEPNNTAFEPFTKTYDVIGNEMMWYNIYKPTTHNPTKGDCPHSIEMVKHIFGTNKITFEGKEFYEYDLGFDYIKLLWENPTQILPILVLASEERKTGKTTFWDWMRDIFQQNARKVEGEELSKQFTSYYVNALLVVIEEAFFDKKQTIERLKEMVTARRGKMESKGKDAIEVDTFIHVGISTNNLTNFAKIDKEETRFWIRKVPPIPKEKEKFDLLEVLKGEIDYFLQYLMDRDYVTIRKSRSWFAEELLITDELQNVKSESRWNIEIAMENALKEYMSQVRKGYVELASGDIRSLISEKCDYNIIRKVVEHNWKIKKSKYSQYYNKYSWYPSEENDNLNPHGIIKVERLSNMVYDFLIDRFYEPHDYLQFITDHEDLELLEQKQIALGEKTFWEKITNNDRVILGKRINSLLTIENIEMLILENNIDSYKQLYNTINETPF